MKFLKTNIFTLFLFSVICIFLYSQENLVLNGDFEDLYQNLPNHWSKEAWLIEETVTRYYIESENPHSGNYYVTIENLQKNDARLTQVVAVKPFTYYRLSAWVKAGNCNADRLGANLSVMHPDLYTTSKDFKDTWGEWKYLEYNVRTGQQETMIVAVRLGGFGNDTMGKASFDDFRLEEITDPTGLTVVDIMKDDGIEAAREKKSFPSLIIFIIALSVLVITGVFFLYFFFIKPMLIPDSKDKTALLQKTQKGYTKKDWILAGSITIIYAIVAFINLGSLKAPQTYWKPASMGEDVVADLGEVKNVRRIYYFHGLPGGHGPDAEYGVDTSINGIDWTYVGTIESKTIYYWYNISTNIQARYIKITVIKPKSWLNEVVITGEDSKQPLNIVDVFSQGGINHLSEGDIRNLFDEQDTYAYRPTHLNGMSIGFNEQYFTRTAMEHILFDDPYEDTHPPLGKLLIALGILLFGMTPFGWRFMGTFFGILMIPVMYAFGKDLFKKSEYAFLASLFMSLDFMHFTQTRIGVVDSFVVFFIILMYFFMYRHYKMSFFTTDFKKTLIPLLLSGICVGLGCATKWIGVYAILGLFVLGVGSVIKKGAEYREIKKKLSSESPVEEQEEWNRMKTIADKVPVYIGLTILLSFTLFFVIIPAIIYFLSFVPIWVVPEVSRNSPNIFHFVLKSVAGMYDYHRNVTYTHGFYSPWWEWPLMIKPIWYHVPEELPPGQMQRLFAFGNPAIWWTGSFAMIPAIILAITRFFKGFSKNGKKAQYNNSALFLILAGFISQYIVWIFSPRRLTFIFYYFPSVPFIILVLVFFIQQARENWIPGIVEKNPGIKEKFLYNLLNGAVIAFILITVVLFIMFYPIIAGVPADVNYIRIFLKWLPTWYFA